jgi:hypothetical protein
MTKQITSVDLYAGDETTAFIGPTGGERLWAFKPGDYLSSFATIADALTDSTSHGDSYRRASEGHFTVPVNDPAVGEVVATYTAGGLVEHRSATGAARTFLGGGR